MQTKGLDNIAICGTGIAFEYCLAALAHSLGNDINITAIELEDLPVKDAFYGNVTSPEIYKFHLSLGLTEPDLLLSTDTSFCYGTRYQSWADRMNWTQSYHLPFPIWENIPFHHYLIKAKAELEPYLVSAVCGTSGVFAHPPGDPNVPLSRAEYGYQLRPQSIARLLSQKSLPENVTRIKGSIDKIQVTGGHITAIKLQDKQNIQASFFIDASGDASLLMEALDNKFESRRTLCVLESTKPRSSEGTALRKVTGFDFGWQSQTNLRESINLLSIFHPDGKAKATESHNASNAQIFKICIGQRSVGWTGNCAAIGHASYTTEPHTPAPLLLLQRDIERLLSLLPNSANMTVEAKEYNRLRDNDLEHSELFNRAFFEAPNLPKTSYWQDATKTETPSKLTRKIEQFESRGFLTSFDLEPFNEQDWTILHFGMQRRAQRHDIYLDNLPESAIQQRLGQMQMSIKNMAGKMPPHDRYLMKFRQYLEKKRAENA